MTSLYSVDKLMSETRKIAAQYHKTTGSVLPVSNELAKYDVCRLLDFTNPEQTEQGVDLIANKKWKKCKVQVKSRVIFDESRSKPRVGKLDVSSAWELVVLVTMDKEYNPEEIYIANKSTIAEATKQLKSNKGTLSVARFKSISDLVWQSE